MEQLLGPEGLPRAASQDAADRLADEQQLARCQLAQRVHGAADACGARRAEWRVIRRGASNTPVPQLAPHPPHTHTQARLALHRGALRLQHARSPTAAPLDTRTSTGPMLRCRSYSGSEYRRPRSASIICAAFLDAASCTGCRRTCATARPRDAPPHAVACRYSGLPGVCTHEFMESGPMRLEVSGGTIQP